MTPEMYVLGLLSRCHVEMDADLLNAIFFAHGGWSTLARAGKEPTKLSRILHAADIYSSQILGK